MTLDDFVALMRREPDLQIHVCPLPNLGSSAPGKLEAEVAPGTRAVLFIQESLLSAYGAEAVTVTPSP